MESSGATGNSWPSGIVTTSQLRGAADASSARSRSVNATAAWPRTRRSWRTATRASIRSASCKPSLRQGKLSRREAAGRGRSRRARFPYRPPLMPPRGCHARPARHPGTAPRIGRRTRRCSRRIPIFPAQSERPRSVPSHTEPARARPITSTLVHRTASAGSTSREPSRCASRMWKHQAAESCRC